MVRIIAFWITLLFMVSVFAQEVVVTSEIDGIGTVGAPLKGTVMVTHDKSAKVDVHSFMLGKEPLEAKYLRDVQIAPNSPLIISIYSFTLVPKKAGLKELPEVSVKVEGKEYRSFASTYRVEEAGEALQSSKSSIILQIRPLIIGNTSLYPGQRIKVGYRYTFNYSQDLKEEYLPLLDAKGFKKIGGIKSEKKLSGKLVNLDVLQEIEAVKPGVFTFEPAKIKGRAWRKGKWGAKDFAKRDSFAQSKPATIDVLPFPQKGKPGSFNGAIGKNLSFKVSLLTSNHVTVGDKIRLELSFSGAGELASLPLPELCCQPGMSGFFRLSDLPAQESLQDGTKSFIVEMRPLNDKAKEIPSLEFSYFNPEEKRYYTKKSVPIPIVITPLEKNNKETELNVSKEFKEAPEGALEKKTKLGAIEIEGNFKLANKDLRNLPFGAPWVLYLIPFGIGSLLLQNHFRSYLLQRQGLKKKKTSNDLFQEAQKIGAEHERFFQLLHEAFILRLYEIGEIDRESLSTDLLPDEGISGRVKSLLKEIEEMRFSQKREEIESNLLQKINNLFKEIR